MVEKLASMGMMIEWERVQEIAGEASVGRPHIAQALVEAGYVTKVAEAFDRWIGRNGPAYVEREKMTPAEAVADARALGAPRVLAHPSYIEERSRRAAGARVQAGMAGMEVYYKDYDEDDRRACRAGEAVRPPAARRQRLPRPGNPTSASPATSPCPTASRATSSRKSCPGCRPSTD